MNKWSYIKLFAAKNALQREKRAFVVTNALFKSMLTF